MEKFKMFDTALLKPGYSLINGRQYFVTPKDFGGSTADAQYVERLKLSPFTAVKLETMTAEQVDQGYATLEQNECTLFMANEVKKLKAGVCIFMEERVIERMESAEILSIIAHEEGHIQHAHMDSYSQDDLEMVNGVPLLVKENYELEADAYSVDVFGPEVFGRALVKTMQMMIFDIGRLTGRTQEEMDRASKGMVKVPGLYGRLEAIGQTHLLDI